MGASGINDPSIKVWFYKAARMLVFLFSKYIVIYSWLVLQTRVLRDISHRLTKQKT